MSKLKGIRIRDVVFCVILLVLTGVVELTFHAENHSVSKKLLLCHALLLGFAFLSAWLKRKKAGAKDKGPERILSVLLVPAIPAALFFLTQYGIYFKNNIEAPYIAYGILLLLLLFFVLFFLTGFAKAAQMVLVLLSVVLLFVNYFVTQFRGRPFTVMDVVGARTAMNVMSNYTFSITLKMAVIADGYLALLTAAWFWQELVFPRGKRTWLLRAGFTALSVLVFALFIRFFVLTQNFSTARLFNPAKTYGRYGYWYVMIAEITYLNVEEPEGYDPRTVREETARLAEETPEAAAESVGPAEETPEAASESGSLAEETPEAAAESGGLTEETQEAASENTEIVPENIIVIMNESLADLETLGTVKTDTPLLPFLHSLGTNVTHGKLYVHVFGGGTADTEYEFLTGNSKQFLPEGMVSYEAYTHDPEYGLVTALKSFGYRAIAMHPNRAANWNREHVYERMQFDEFFSMENWPTETERIRSYVSDRSVYDTILQLYDEKAEGEKLFTFCVTMQNHGGYTKSTWGDSFTPDVHLNYKKSYPRAEAYLSLANESDRAFEYLTEQFAGSDEPTMIILFGDHLPNLEAGFYKKVLGKKEADLSAEENLMRYQTPYVIWTNYDRPSRELDLSTNYLGSIMLQEANLPLLPYNKLILESREQLPVIGLNAVADSDGNWHSTEELPEDLAGLFRMYQYFQYNQIFDRKNLVTEAFAP